MKVGEQLFLLYHRILFICVHILILHMLKFPFLLLHNKLFPKIKKKEHNKCNALESPLNYPLYTWSMEKLSSRKSVPGSEKFGDCWEITGTNDLSWNHHWNQSKVSQWVVWIRAACIMLSLVKSTRTNSRQRSQDVFTHSPQKGDDSE